MKEYEKQKNFQTINFAFEIRELHTIEFIARLNFRIYKSDAGEKSFTSELQIIGVHCPTAQINELYWFCEIKTYKFPPNWTSWNFNAFHTNVSLAFPQRSLISRFAYFSCSRAKIKLKTLRRVVGKWIVSTPCKNKKSEEEKKSPMTFMLRIAGCE